MIKCNVRILRDALKRCGLAVATRTSLPITNDVLLDFKENVLTISGTDLEKIISVTIPCVGEPMSVCVPYKIFSKFVSVGEGEVSMTVAGKSMAIERPKIGTFQIVVAKAEDFPVTPKMKNTVWSKLNAKEVCRLFGIVSNACATDESRPVLTGVCCRDGEIAAADGFRLYTAKNDKFKFGLSDKFESENDAAPPKLVPVQRIIPRQTIIRMNQLFGKLGEVEVSFDDDKVSFKNHDCTIISQLVQGTFPRYEQLLPQSWATRFSFSAPVMADRINMMDLSDGSGIMRLLMKNDDEFCIKGGMEEIGDYELTMPCKAEVFSSMEGYARIAFNYKYVYDVVRHFSICHLEITNPSSPGKITGDIEGLTMVIMPCFVQW